MQDLSGLTILVLDDDANMRTLVRDILARHGCQKVLQKRDARDALDLFSSHSIDLVLSDWSMDPMSGLEFLHELRRPERDIRVPVIMLTANSEPHDMLLAKTLGINGWLVKPIAPQRLMSQVARVLSLSEQSILADDDLAEEMAVLAERYKSQLANDLRDLDGLLGSILQQQRNTTYTWLAIDRLLHRVKGQAGSFGYQLVTSIAALGMDLLRRAESNVALLSRHRAELVRCMTVLAEAMRLVLQNQIRGDGGDTGARMLDKLRLYVAQAKNRLEADPECH